MKYISKELVEWAVNKIKKEYSDDVSLLIGHQHWNIEPDGDEVAFNFFIPKNERGYKLAQTFIIDGIGYDLFPMSWERVEGLAELNESLTTCLADGVILYARHQEDKERFFNLQKRLRDNLNNDEFIYKKGLEKINTAMELYKNMLFDNSLSHIRKAAGYLVDYLAQAVAAINGTYFKRGPENQIANLKEMKEVPVDFISLYVGIVLAKTGDESKRLCYQIIERTRKFFSERTLLEEPKKTEYNFEDLADWYEEGTYTFRRIYYYCEQKDIFNCFAWGYNFQYEFDFIEEEFGLETMDLMGVFNPDDLTPFYYRAKEIEEYIVAVIKQNGAIIQEFANLDEFIKQNG